MPRGNLANLGHYAHPRGGYKGSTGPLGKAPVVPAQSLKSTSSIGPGGTGVARPMVGATGPVIPPLMTPPSPKLGMFSPKPPVTSRITAGAPTRKKGK